MYTQKGRLRQLIIFQVITTCWTRWWNLTYWTTLHTHSSSSVISWKLTNWRKSWWRWGRTIREYKITSFSFTNRSVKVSVWSEVLLCSNTWSNNSNLFSWQWDLTDQMMKLENLSGAKRQISSVHVRKVIQLRCERSVGFIRNSGFFECPQTLNSFIFMQFFNKRP